MRHITYMLRTTATLIIMMLATTSMSALDKIGNVYCIHNADELNDFGKLVANGETTANGMLMNDIDFSGWTSWEPIGGRGPGNPNPYCGHFDGGGHRIMNLVVDNASKGWSAQGVFGRVTAGCVIANLVFDSSCSISGKNFVGGIAGKVSGVAKGTVKFVNCGNEGNVSCNMTEGSNAGGILGGNESKEIQVELKNCYNAGNVGGYSWCGAISGKVESAPIVTNCYNIGTVKETIGASMNFVANC